MASNVFFDWLASAARFSKGTKVRADGVNSALDSVTAGFDKLPTEDQLNRGTRNYIASDTGAADAYAGSLSHVTSYNDGQEVDILIANANATTTPTLNVSTVGATIIKTTGANAVAIGALAQNSIARFKYNATGGHWELIGVYDITSTVSAFMATMLDDADARAALTTLGIPTQSGGFSVVLTDGTNDATTTAEVGNYEVIGNLCIVHISIVVISKGSLSGALQITGLPLTPALSGFHLGCSTSSNLTSRSDLYQIHGSVDTDQIIYLKKQGATGITPLLDTDISASTEIKLSGVIYL